MPEYDDFNPELLSQDTFRSRFYALLRERKMTFVAMYTKAGVSRHEALRAIDQGEEGLCTNRGILERMLFVLGVSLEFLFSPTVCSTDPIKKQRLQLFELGHSYASSAELPRIERDKLVAELMGVYESIPTETRLMAARPGLPRTLIEMGYFHKKLINQGKLPAR